MPTTSLKDFYSNINEDSLLFVVIVEGEGPYFEGPREQDLLDTEPQETLMRMFVSREEAARYAETISEYNQECVFALIKMSLVDLWKVVHILNERSKLVFKFPLRVDLCYNLPNGYPESVDTIWNQNIIKQ